jgi:hypothetical protein
MRRLGELNLNGLYVVCVKSVCMLCVFKPIARVAGLVASAEMCACGACPGGQRLLRMGRDQGGVDIDHQRRSGTGARSGACSPAADHTTARAHARAVSIALNARDASAAKASIVRDTVGSEATRPNTDGSARSSATSARQSPPSASVTARSVITFAGSCRAVGLRHGASTADNAVSTPHARTVSTRATPPACDATPVPDVSAWTRGYIPLRFTLKGAPRSTTSVTRHLRFSLTWSTFQLITTPSPTKAAG